MGKSGTNVYTSRHETLGVGVQSSETRQSVSQIQRPPPEGPKNKPKEIESMRPTIHKDGVDHRTQTRPDDKARANIGRYPKSNGKQRYKL